MDENKNIQTTPTRTYCKRSRPLLYCNPNCRTPRHWKFTQDKSTNRPPPTKLKPPVNINLYSIRKLCSATVPYREFELFKIASEPTCRTYNVDVGTSLFEMIPSVLAPVYTPTRATTTMQRNITNGLQSASVSDMGFTAHQHKKAISRRIRYKIIHPICRKS